MTCEHISRAKQKINSLIGKLNNYDPTVCKKMDPYLEWEQITIFREVEYQRAVATLVVGGEQVYINAMNINGLDNAFSDIFAFVWLSRFLYLVDILLCVVVFWVLYSFGNTLYLFVV